MRLNTLSDVCKYLIMKPLNKIVIINIYIEIISFTSVYISIFFKAVLKFFKFPFLIDIDKIKCFIIYKQQ